MKRFLIGSLAAALLLASQFSSTQAATMGTGMTNEPAIKTPSSAWAETATRANVLTNAKYLGALNPATPLRIVVGLQVRNPQQINSLLKAQNTPGNALFHSELTPAQFASMYAPTNAQVAQVVSYLAAKHFTGISVEPNNLLISATAPAAQVSSAFHTTLGTFSQNGRIVYSNLTPAFVPTSLGSSVLAVLGLNNAVSVRRHMIAAKNYRGALQNAVTPCLNPVPGTDHCLLRNIDGPTVQKVYNAGTVPSAYKTTLAVMAEGDVRAVLPDLRYMESKEGLPAVPYSVVQVGIPSPDTAGVTEWDLDTQASSGIAQTLKHLYLYTTTSLTDSDIALEYNKWVTQNVARIGNSSFGGCEIYSYIDGSMLVDDEMFLEGAVQGQTMFASTGDTGANQCSVGNPNGVPAGVPFGEYPSTSPYVVAVGGTSLFTKTSDASYDGEMVWQGTGGGLSQFEYSPYWECGVQPLAPKATSCGVVAFSFRGEPDVAMEADPNLQGYVVYINKTPTGVGGTSLASPLAAGGYARMQTADNNGLGFAPPKFYKVYNPAATDYPGDTTQSPVGPSFTTPNGGFHDILYGGSGIIPVLGQAKNDWDYVTGLGSYDISALTAKLKKLCPKTL